MSVAVGRRQLGGEKEKKFVIEHTFKDVSNMKPNTSVNGPFTKYGGVNWCIRIHKDRNSQFRFHLECLPFKVSDGWKIETTLSGNALYSNSKQVFDSQNMSSKTSSYTTSIESFFVGQKLPVTFNIKIDEITGIKTAKLRTFEDDSAKEFSDVVLIAGDQKFHVSKMYLSLHSSYFKALFSGNFSESGKSEIELKNIEAKHFQRFLEVIYGEPAIDEHSYIEIVKLADFFDSKTAISRCEEFILNKSPASLKTKFQLANKYKMDELKVYEVHLRNENQCRIRIDSSTKERVFTEDCSSSDDLTYITLSNYGGYSGNNEMRVDFHVNINKMTGFEQKKLRNFDDEAAKEHSDVVLKIGDQKFYVYKSYLSLHSSYFKALFSGNFSESGKSEIELKDIDADNLQRFLEVIYGEPAIDKKNHVGILKLADFFDSKTVIRRCEEFLVNKSATSLKTKFELGNKYKMEKLKKRCIFEISTSAEFKSIIPENAAELEHDTWKELLKKSTRYF